MLYEEKVVSGLELCDDCTYDAENALFSLRGCDIHEKHSISVPITTDLLSKHILLLGGIGSGKTTTINHLVKNIRENMTEDDVMIIFDSKRDYYDTFYRPGDIVFSNDDTASGGNGPDYWNIFREVSIDDRVEENILEVSKILFSEKLEKTSQPFFPNAAKDLFSALMLDLVRSENKAPYRNNMQLRSLLNTFSVPAMKNVLSHHIDLKAMQSYIEKEDSGQTQGVVSELQQLVREIFVGNFAQKGGLSIREIVRDKGKKVVFIEYDLSIGSMLTPIYRLIIDLAIKQALCRKKDGEKGNVYFILDEFRLLPKLEHVDDGINFGRSLGVKFIVGIQNISQVMAAYGENTGISLLSGFSTNISFRVGDKHSREYIRGLYGENLLMHSYTSDIALKRPEEILRSGSVVEDGDVLQLATGEAIVGIMKRPPFVVRFDDFEK